MGFKEDWSHGTPYLFFCVAVFACGDLIYGTDASIFGAMQALPSWLNQFGDTIGPDGQRTLTTYARAICNSINFIGLLAGCLTFEVVVERTGYKLLLFLISILQCIAVVVQCTAKTWQVFTVGRIFAYLAVGYICNCVPVYSAEVSPAPLRGFCAGLLTPIISVSSIWGAGMCQAYAEELGKKGYIIPVASQAIPAVIIFIALPFTVESPRWLLSHGKKEQAIKALAKLRKKEAYESGAVAAEVEALYVAIEFDKENSNTRWRDMLPRRGYNSYFRRALYSGLLFWFYQSTGNSFYNAYGPTFFVNVGLGSKSFTYATIVQLVGAIGSFMAVFLTDRIGRRPLILFGGTLLIVFNSLIAGFGVGDDRTDAKNNVVIASFILMIWSTKVSWATHSYMIASELGGIHMRKKIMMVGTTTETFTAWLVSFTSPYIMDEPYGGIGGNIGYVFAGMALIAMFFGIFFVPELRGRSLEEVDELFEVPRWGWQFKGVKTSGVGATIAQLEHGARPAFDSKMEDVEAEGFKHNETVLVGDVRR